MATQLDLTVNQGTTIEKTFVVQDASTGILAPYDASQSSVRMHARRSIDTKGAPALDCTPYLFMEDAALGKIHLRLPPAVTSAITSKVKEAKTIKLVYDLEMVDASAKVHRLYYGSITIVREITR